MSEYDRLKAQYDAMRAKEIKKACKPLRDSLVTLRNQMATRAMQEFGDAKMSASAAFREALEGINLLLGEDESNSQPCAAELWNTNQVAPRSCQRCRLGPCALGLVRKEIGGVPMQERQD